MKKQLIINVLLCIVFALLDPLLDWCGDLADMYSLGAEMVLGMAIPFVIVLFVAFAVCSVCFSLYNCICKKDVKYTIPTFVLIAFIAMYFRMSSQDNLWIRVLEYYS